MNGLLFRKGLRSAVPGEQRGAAGTQPRGPGLLPRGPTVGVGRTCPPGAPCRENHVQTGEATSVRRLSPHCPSAEPGALPHTLHSSPPSRLAERTTPLRSLPASQVVQGQESSFQTFPDSSGYKYVSGQNANETPETSLSST